MKLRIALIVCLLALAGCRTNTNSISTSIDLLKRLHFAEKSEDSQVILFGHPEGRSFLLSGWSEPQRDGNETFQWASAERASFFFNTKEVEPLYLHVKLGSFFANSTEVLLNKKSAGRIQIDGEAEVYSIPLPAEAMQLNTNVVEFNWDQLRSQNTSNNSRQVAAAAYFAVITPAQYLSGSPLSNKSPQFSPEFLQIEGKKRAALNLPMGGTIRYYENLNKNSRLQFGVHYHPPSMPEDQDFAEFSLTLRKDGEAEQRIYHNRSSGKVTSFERIGLSKYISADEPSAYEIEFKLVRNSVFDTGKAAWIEPVLYQDVSETEVPKKAIDSIRDANERANVIVIVLDAAGAKHFQTYGYSRKTTPNIETLAKEGVQFDRAYCQAVYTLASTASLMTGLDPYQHRIILRKSKLPAQMYTLAERFSDGGYSTGTFVANGNASSIFGMTQGFHEVNEVFREENYTGWGSDITNRFMQWMDKRQNERPFFAYLHYREPHAPFNPPEVFKNRFTDPNYTGFRDASYEMRRKINMGEVSATQADRDYIIATYDENLLYGDYEVGRVIQKLKKMKVYEKTVILVTADHGEAFWEHNFQGHNSQLYEESIHIPLIVKFAERTKFDRKSISQPVRTIDIYPSLVDLVKLSHRNWNVNGQSFLAYLTSGELKPLPVISQTIAEQAYCYMENGYKYIVRLQTREEELYNLKADPGERQNRIQQDLVQAAYLRSRLFGWLAASKKIGAWQKTERAVIDETTRENLKALGYIDE